MIQQTLVYYRKNHILNLFTTTITIYYFLNITTSNHIKQFIFTTLLQIILISIIIIEYSYLLIQLLIQLHILSQLQLSNNKTCCSKRIFTLTLNFIIFLKSNLETYLFGTIRRSTSGSMKQLLTPQNFIYFYFSLGHSLVIHWSLMNDSSYFLCLTSNYSIFKLL